MKRCTKCKIEQDLNCFCKELKNKSGLTNYCKTCRNTDNREWRFKNYDKLKKQDEQLNRRFTSGIHDAKKRNKSWDLTFEQYSELVSHPCYYCHNLLGEKVKKGTGLDRMDNNIGYSHTNCVSCCRTCNVVKSNLFTVEETKEMIKSVMKIKGLIYA